MTCLEPIIPDTMLQYILYQQYMYHTGAYFKKKSLSNDLYDDVT